ncbi:hypothetical protein ACLB2K_051425 [Fragaria x ananassa]
MRDKLTMSISSDSSVDDRWSKDLPHELVDMIVKRLWLFDSISCTAVCSSWRLVWKRRFGNQFPFILRSLPYQSYYSLYSPGEDRATNNLRFPKGVLVDCHGTASYCSGSYGSWLIFAEHSQHPKSARSYFFNPLSGAGIALPPHSNPSFFLRDDETGCDEKVIVKTVASSDPTDPNCIVAALTIHSHTLAFCRLNAASWTLQHDTPVEGGFGSTDLHFHEEELYATVGRMIDAVQMFDPIEVLSQTQCGSDEADAFKGKCLCVEPLQLHTMRDPSFSLITSSSGEMLLVLKDERKWKNDTEEFSFLVFRCKVNKTIRIMGDIGAETLIAMAKPTNSMPVIDKLGGHGSGNCIYFTNGKDDRIGVYNLADRTLKYPLTGGLQQTHSKIVFMLMLHILKLWSKDLPHELVERIVKRLGLFDFISCTAVCSSWRSSVAMASKSRFENQFPFILRSVPYHQDCYSLYSPAEDPSFFVRDRRAGGKVFIKTVASSDPTDPNCIVAAIALHGYRVAFCRPNDASWTLQYPPNTPLRGGYGFTDLHFHEGELYATVGRTIDVVLIFDPLEVLSQSQGSYKGKLLGVSPLEGHIVLRWKTCVTKNVDKTIREGYLKYEVMNNIGEQAMFIGNIGAKSLMAMAKPTNSMPVIGKLGGHRSGNCIYFNEKDDRR